MTSGAAARRVIRDVDPEAVRDLLEHPPRATVAYVADGTVSVAPARARGAGGTHRFAVAAGAAPDLDGREVVLVGDDGPFWFQLRGLSVRGIARAEASSEPSPDLVWYVIDPRRVLAWDYATLREE